MNDKIESIKHKDTRVHIPSREEAGCETASEKVTKGKDKASIPKNPVVHRGQDPELFWLNKYGSDDRDDILKFDIRSLYRHEHVAPEQIIKGLYKVTVEDKNPDQMDLFATPNELFGNALDHDELDKVSEYYKHHDGWTNRLIQGDSLLVMGSLLEREGMAGQVQCIYMDPPYGIKYNSNWQMRINDSNVKDGSDDHLTGEPEMIKAFRDTWELGIHSYLSYLRERLLISRELLTESGSCFVQISDENVHLVRCLMDEVFGSENFVSLIVYKKGGTATSQTLSNIADFIIWYAKDKDKIKYRQLFDKKTVGEGESTGERYDQLESPDGKIRRPMSLEEKNDSKLIPDAWKPFKLSNPCSQHDNPKHREKPLIYETKEYYPPKDRQWSVSPEKMYNLIKKNRLISTGKNLAYVMYLDDYPVMPVNNIWSEFLLRTSRIYVVQTSVKVIEQCILMSTDPGDLVLDPTCGSGTTASVAEQWGRRWITIDTSRIAINIAKTRLMTATLPYYKLHDEKSRDIRQGFVYKTVPHITLKSLANNEPAEQETLFDQPEVEKKTLRVTGPFTVETLQNFEPVSPESLDNGTIQSDDSGVFEARIFEHMKSAGVKNGIKNEQALFTRVDSLSDSYLHAEGFYNTASGEKKAYVHIGPKFGTVSKLAVNEAVKACRTRGDADWLIILGFSFESAITNENITTSVGSFEVTKVRMHDDLMQDGLLKKDKRAASFITIGEPDVQFHITKKEAVVEICGLDIYDPVRDEVKARSVEDIAYWMVDTDYDSSNFVVHQVFFCGGDKDEFAKWRKGLDELAKEKAKKNVEKTLKIEIDDEAFDRLYGFKSHPFKAEKGQKVAVRVVSQFGEESMKVLVV